MASLTKKRGSIAWIACFTDADGIQRQRSTGLKDAGDAASRAKNRRRANDIAQNYETTARGDRTEAQIRKAMSELFNRVSGKRIDWATAKAFLANWLDRVKIRKSSATFRRYETVVEGFLASLGTKASKALGDVTTEDVQGYFDHQLIAGKRAGTLRTEGKILNAAFAYALRQGLVIINPITAAEIPDDASESKRPFSWEQVRAIVAACDPAQWEDGDRILPRLGEWKTAILCAAFTGARLGDARNLRWGNIDLPGKVIRFRPSKTKRQAKDVWVPMHPTLEGHLLDLAVTDNPDTPLMPSLASERIGGRPGLSRQFQRIMAQAGVENETLSGGEESGGRAVNAYGFHSLRHTFNTVLADAGVDQELRMALSGHAGERVNELYTHRGLKTLRAAVEKLPGF